MLYQYVDGFLNHLRVEKNASGMTIVSYRTDLTQFFEFLSEFNSLPRDLVSKELFNHKSVRDYLTHLQNNGFSRSTMA
ncbi:MAG: site-specific integrase, partial [Bacillota bacterium]